MATLQSWQFTGLGIVLILGYGMAHGQPLPSIPLTCRIGQEPWQECRMELREVGRHWFLRVGQRRFEFRHDGTGRVLLRENGPWREVTPHWEERALCWDTVCARGDLPLD